MNVRRADVIRAIAAGVQCIMQLFNIVNMGGCLCLELLWRHCGWRFGLC